jgi:hypothetical protein
MKKNLIAAIACIHLTGLAEAAPITLLDQAGARTTFKPGETLALSSGWLIRDYRPTWSDATQFAAMPFSLPTSSTLNEVELALTSLASWSGTYSVRVLEDSGGSPGMTTVWQADTLEAAPIFTLGSSYDFTSATGVAADLDANKTYWLFVGCQSNCELTWWADAANPVPGAIQHNNIFPYNLRWTVSQGSAAMFRLQGELSTVPEPAPVSLLAMGVGLLFALRRRAA